ncbi:hypothetical protein JTB14_016890 [Gonioctena quinquepunctata]|nr:hypothetical protein JTB14_016890 [Gonioctena quinquepunctata]
MKKEVEEEIATDNLSLNKVSGETLANDDEQMLRIQELSIPMIESITDDYLKCFRFFNNRYFEDRYFVNFTNLGKQQSNDDVLVRVHTNKLLLIAVASGHDIMTQNKDIVEINFVVNNRDRSKINTSGKRKIGAKALEPHTIVCQVRLDGDSRMYNIRAGVKGLLIEINELELLCQKAPSVNWNIV